MEFKKHLESLEISLIEQEITIEKLDKVIYEQEKRISRLEILCKEILQNNYDLNSFHSKESNEKPPHW